MGRSSHRLRLGFLKKNHFYDLNTHVVSLAPNPSSTLSTRNVNFLTVWLEVKLRSWPNSVQSRLLKREVASTDQWFSCVLVRSETRFSFISVVLISLLIHIWSSQIYSTRKQSALRWRVRLNCWSQFANLYLDSNMDTSQLKWNELLCDSVGRRPSSAMFHHEKWCSSGCSFFPNFVIEFFVEMTLSPCENGGINIRSCKKSSYSISGQPCASGWKPKL